MFTLGYSFRPWEEAEGDRRRAADPRLHARDRREYGIDAGIRYGHRVISAALVERRRPLDGRGRAPRAGGSERLTCDFLFGCTGYYRYDEGYTPEFAGIERFAGQVVHPQHWPDDLDYAGKRVVVIGSGATAVTLVPALAEQAEHVTMLQRSPSY